MADDKILKTEHLRVGYESTVVVDDVCLAVRPGEVLTLIGANGSGKSTILKSMTHQLALLGGVVYLDGKSLADMKESELAQKLSMVMTDRVRPEYMTCRDVVATGRYPYTGRMGILSEEDYRAVDEAMALVHADAVADRDFLKISDGQRQRVMLARALCQETDVLILDEPTSFLDMKYKLDILTSIRKMARERKLAVIMSLHELDLAEKVSDTVACVHNARIEKVGRPEEIFCGDFIQKLYGVSRESFDPVFGSIQFTAAPRPPEIFVIGGGGSATMLYYRLGREDIPFATGILQENDLDYVTAKSMASQVVASPAFYPIGKEEIESARHWIDVCTRCICTLQSFGPLIEANRALREYAASCGKLTESL